MTTYAKLKLHLERHEYKRGQFKGDAPLDAKRRGRSHTRVFDHGLRRGVIMHNTRILTAYEDRFVLDSRGWHDSPTTRDAMNRALCFTPLAGSYLHSRIVGGISQTALALRGWNAVLYYDGMEFDADGKLTTPLKPFMQRRINREESKEFMQEVKDSRFKAMFPLLYATSPEPDGTLSTRSNTALKEAITRDYMAHTWGDIVQSIKYKREYDYKNGRSIWVPRGDAKYCWSMLMTACKKEMYETVTSTQTIITN